MIKLRLMIVEDDPALLSKLKNTCIQEQVNRSDEALLSQ